MAEQGTECHGQVAGLISEASRVSTHVHGVIMWTTQYTLSALKVILLL